MKQTAVEWLSEHLCNEMNFDYWQAVEKAKDMEKDQIKDAWLNSLTKGDFNSADEYYNQTYKDSEQ